MALVVLSLGSSLGNRKEILQDAINSVNKKIGLVKMISKIYETEPWGFADENLFLNMAVLIETKLTPQKILNSIKIIEKQFKRVKNINTYEPRTLDIDIIFYDDLILNTEELQIPHKFAHKRQFVLMPISDICPDFIHPVLNKTISDLLQNCNDTSKIKLFEPKSA